MKTKKAMLLVVISLFFLSGCSTLSVFDVELPIAEEQSTAIDATKFSSILRANGAEATGGERASVSDNIIASEYVIAKNHSSLYTMFFFRFDSQEDAGDAFTYITQNLDKITGRDIAASEVTRIEPIYMGSVIGKFNTFDAKTDEELIRVIRHDQVTLVYIGKHYYFVGDKSPTIFSLLGY